MSRNREQEKKLLLKEWATHLMEGKYSQNTLVAYTKDVSSFLSYVEERYLNVDMMLLNNFKGIRF